MDYSPTEKNQIEQALARVNKWRELAVRAQTEAEVWKNIASEAILAVEAIAHNLRRNGERMLEVSHVDSTIPTSSVCCFPGHSPNEDLAALSRYPPPAGRVYSPQTRHANSQRNCHRHRALDRMLNGESIHRQNPYLQAHATEAESCELPDDRENHRSMSHCNAEADSLTLRWPDSERGDVLAFTDSSISTSTSSFADVAFSNCNESPSSVQKPQQQRAPLFNHSQPLTHSHSKKLHMTSRKDSPSSGNGCMSTHQHKKKLVPGFFRLVAHLKRGLHHDKKKKHKHDGNGHNPDNHGVD